uniref:Large ribosomal subunit protein bL21m n=1 Tax=Globodera rostochiensis TaxID=31243 RepID=A0A914GUK7_GLORO
MHKFTSRCLPAFLCTLRPRSILTNSQKFSSNTASSSRQLTVKKPLIKSTVLEPEAYDLAERRKWVVENISSAIDDPTRMLFAVIYIQGRQYKVIQDDVIHIEHNIPLDVGEEIILEKVLMVGDVEFTLIGRPLLDPKFVHIRATVIEKTTTSPEVQYNFRVKSVFNPVWLSQELTVVRINRIHVEKTLLGES